MIIDLTAFPFVQASQYTPANRTEINLLVLHTMEAPEKPGTALGVAHFFQTIDHPASAHWCIDADTAIHCVQHKDVAYGAPGANRFGIHFEHAGYAAQSAPDWQDAYSQKMLHLSAKIVAQVAADYHIPLVWLSVEDLKAGKRGVTSHRNCSLAFGGTHTDPGPNFPQDQYLSYLHAA